jgi:hypothetical protein
MITITDSEFGCGIHFADRKENFVENQSYQEIMESLGQYVSLNRTYGEDDLEEDYYYVEFSDFDKSGQLEDFEITLSHSSFTLGYRSEVFEVEFNEDLDLPFDQVKEILEKVVNGRGKLEILD